MRAAILPIVCPPTAVKAQKYESFTSRRNATSGTGGTAAHWAIGMPAIRRVK
jgi:hypothetical protein